MIGGVLVVVDDGGVRFMVSEVIGFSKICYFSIALFYVYLIIWRAHSITPTQSSTCSTFRIYIFKYILLLRPSCSDELAKATTASNHASDNSNTLQAAYTLRYQHTTHHQHLWKNKWIYVKIIITSERGSSTNKDT